MAARSPSRRRARLLELLRLQGGLARLHVAEVRMLHNDDLARLLDLAELRRGEVGNATKYGTYVLPGGEIAGYVDGLRVLVDERSALSLG